MSDFLKVDSLDGAGRAALKRLILTLADSKRMMGIRYSDWLLGAPTIESGIAASAMTQDEWGHARLLYAMLKELGVDPEAVEHDRPGAEFASVGPLDEPFSDWAAVVAGMVIVDGAISVALEAFGRGTFEPATTRVPKMLAEEGFHVSLGAAWYKRLADSSDEAKQLLREATERMLPPVLAWLGTADEAARSMVEAGVTDSGAHQVRAFNEAMRDVLSALDVDPDDFEADDAWDSGRGRGPGCPDEESVERARGDRNRMLLVD